MRAIPSPRLVFGAVLCLAFPLTARTAPEVRFARDVQPILQTYCVQCHLEGGEGRLASGFLVDSYANLMAGGRSGPVIAPGRPSASLMYRLMAGEVNDRLRMPHFQEAIPGHSLETIERWIRQGARND